jgi:hypothetical protein
MYFALSSPVVTTVPRLIKPLVFKEDMHLLVFRIRTETIADPDPAFYLNADPDPGNQTNADPDPDPGQTLPSEKVGF